jgi:hypothetical protein
MSKLRHVAMRPINPMPKLAKPSSIWNGLWAQPIKPALSWKGTGRPHCRCGDADREGEEPLEQRLGDHRPREGRRGGGKRDGREDEADDKQGEGEVAEEEAGELLDAPWRAPSTRIACQF